MSAPTILYPEVGGGAWDHPDFFKEPEPILPESECLPAAILLASKQREKVERLVDYCRRLDGTKLHVIELPPQIDQVPHPVGTELAIRYGAKIYQNTPWIYLEADSIPLRPFWRSALTREYRKGNKAFMLPLLAGLSPHDVASAIGVWPAGTADILPADFQTPPWFDLWVYQNKAHELHLTRKIQHSYGKYEGMRVERRWEFPHDKQIIREEAVIFHADPTQSLIRWGAEQAFFSSGDQGDVIAALPIIRQQGGGTLYLGPRSDVQPGPREAMTPEKFASIKSLLLGQPYLKNVVFMPVFDKTLIDRDLSTFRTTRRSALDNLATWQARHVGREFIDLDPWLEIEAEWHGRVVCTRSPRYRNPDFPWKKIVQKYGDRVLFIGTELELVEFHQVVERNVERAICPNLLEMARLLKGAAIQFSNQSLPWWLGAAMGKRVIQESWPEDPNSVIEREYLSYTRTPLELDYLLAALSG